MKGYHTIFTLYLVLSISYELGFAWSSPKELNKGAALSSRRGFLSSTGAVALILTSSTPAVAKKCTDIESCREIGEQKIESEMQANPTITLDNKVRYKVLRGGSGSETVSKGSKVDLIYSISQASGSYMYSKGFGLEKVNFGGKMVYDLGLESLPVKIGNKDVPVGIESALIGMKKGERRRVNLPASKDVGFETSGWKPEPTTRRGKAQLLDVQMRVAGTGRYSGVPPFPTTTIWDVEVLKIRS